MDALLDSKRAVKIGRKSAQVVDVGNEWKQLPNHQTFEAQSFSQKKGSLKAAQPSDRSPMRTARPSGMVPLAFFCLVIETFARFFGIYCSGCLSQSQIHRGSCFSTFFPALQTDEFFSANDHVHGFFKEFVCAYGHLEGAAFWFWQALSRTINLRICDAWKCWKAQFAHNLLVILPQVYPVCPFPVQMFHGLDVEGGLLPPSTWAKLRHWEQLIQIRVDWSM